MIQRICHIVLTALILLVSFATTGAQSEPVLERRLDREKWEELTNDLDYPVSSRPIEEEETRPARNWGPALKVAAVIVSVALIAFMLSQLLSGKSLFSPANRKIQTDLHISLEDIEDNLLEADIPDHLREALRAGDYKMAIRLHYLALIQSLAHRRLIRWEREKTNGDYLRELQAHPLFADFREMTLVFERIWYGDRAVSEPDYRAIEARFSEAAKQVKTS
jgi:hypothetical protein